MLREIRKIFSGQRLEVVGSRVEQILTLEIAAADPVQLIEDLDYPFAAVSHMSVRDRMALLLVYAGKKAAVELPLAGEWPQREVSSWKDDPRVWRFEEVMARLGVEHSLVIMKNPQFVGGYEWPACLVGREGRALDALLKARKTGSPPDDFLYGMAMGYPKTAVQAYCGVRGKRVDQDFQDLVAREHPVNFRLSQGNVEEELAVIQDWSATIQALSPFLWDQWQS